MELGADRIKEIGQLREAVKWEKEFSFSENRTAVLKYSAHSRTGSSGN